MEQYLNNININLPSRVIVREGGSTGRMETGTWANISTGSASTQWTPGGLLQGALRHVASSVADPWQFGMDPDLGSPKTYLWIRIQEAQKHTYGSGSPILVVRVLFQRAPKYLLKILSRKILLTA
jgi:hypothetical protein